VKAKRNTIKWLKSKVHICSLGVENFESGEASGKTSTEVFDWCFPTNTRRSPAFKPADYPKHAEMFCSSFKANYIKFQRCENKNIITLDMRALYNAGGSRELQGHLGWHPDNILKLLEHEAFWGIWKHICHTLLTLLSKLSEEDNEDITTVIVFLCKSGRHRSCALSRATAEILMAHGLAVELEHMSQHKHWPQCSNHASKKCNMCSFTDERAKTTFDNCKKKMQEHEAFAKLKEFFAVKTRLFSTNAVARPRPAALTSMVFA